MLVCVSGILLGFIGASLIYHNNPSKSANIVSLAIALVKKLVKRIKERIAKKKK